MYLSHFAVIHALRLLWPLGDGLVSLVMAYVFTALVSYVVSVATWRLVERQAQALAQRLTSSSKRVDIDVVAARSAA